jgi:hypothetical protein
VSVAIAKGWKDIASFKLHFFVKDARGADQTIFGIKFLIECLGAWVVKASARELSFQA